MMNTHTTKQCTILVSVLSLASVFAIPSYATEFTEFVEIEHFVALDCWSDPCGGKGSADSSIATTNTGSSNALNNVVGLIALGSAGDNTGTLVLFESAPGDDALADLAPAASGSEAETMEATLIAEANKRIQCLKKPLNDPTCAGRL